MRVAILIFPTSNRDSLFSIAKGLSEGIQSQGHQADIFDLKTDEPRVAAYDYVCVGTQGLGLFSGKVHQDISKKLDSLTGLTGKRCAAFLETKLVFAEKTLARLMRAMEGQGLFIRNSVILSKQEDARLFGKELEISRKS